MSTTYVDGTTPLDAAHMNALQQKVEKGAPNGYVALDAASNASLGGYVSANSLFARLGQPEKVAIGALNQLVGGGPAAAGIAFGSALDTTLYRYSTNWLATGGTIWAGWTATPGNGSITVVASGDGWPRVSMLNTGAIQFGPGTSGVDTNLYRVSVNTLQTDGFLYVGKSLLVDAVSGGNPMYFGGALDTNLYRAAAGALKTDQAFVAGYDIWGRYQQATQVVIGDAGGLGKPSIYFGNPLDTNLYRRGAGVLQTDGSLYVNTASGYLGIWQPGDVSLRWSTRYDGMLQWGPGNAGQDTNLYRAGAGYLQTDNNLIVVGQVYARQQLIFGTAGDTNLYRSAAGTLKTDGELQIGGAAPNAQMRLVPDGGGVGKPWIGFGPGGATAVDTNLYRTAAGYLKTDGGLYIGPTATQILLNSNGVIYFGSALDTVLHRTAANTLRTDGTFVATSSGPYNPGLKVDGGGSAHLLHLMKTAGDLNPVFLVDNLGGLNFGPGGATGTNAAITYVSANRLQTGGDWIVGAPVGGNTTAQWTGLWLTIAGVGSRQVAVGLPDSAGAGYRTVMVTN